MNTRTPLIASALLAASLVSGVAHAALTWNGSSWTGTNYDNITIDDTYYAEVPLANFNNVTNYGTITVPVGVNLDFQGVNHGTFTSSSTGLLIESGENFGTFEGTHLLILGSFENHHTMSFGTLSGGSGIFTNNGNLNISSRYAGGYFVNNGTAEIGTLAGLSNFVNTATGSFDATTLDVANLQNHGTGTVSGSITAGILTNGGTLSADSLTITNFDSGASGFTAQLTIATGGSITTTGAVDLLLMGSAGHLDAKSIIDGTLTAGEGVTVASLVDYREFTLAGTGVVNGDVFIDKNGTLDPGLTINGTVSYWAPPPPVPEPETYAMMLAGLGLVGAMARRRKLAKV